MNLDVESVLPPGRDMMKQLVKRFVARFFPGSQKQPVSLPLLAKAPPHPVARFLTMALLDRPERVFSRKSGIQF